MARSLSAARRARGYVASLGGSQPPANTALPAITGTAQEGQVLTVSNGTWTNAPTGYSYQWRRDGTAIAGSINATRTLTAADIGAVMTCVVTATNAGGSASATSAGTAAVIAAASALPVNTVAPAVTGTPAVGQVLTSTTGTWTNSPTSYAYQWRRNGVDIAGATASTYTLVSADYTTSVTCRVFATNSGGTAGATSNAIAVSSSAIVTGMTMAQSEIDYLFNTTSFYRQIAQPTPGNGNLIVFTQDGTGVAPVRTVVNPTTVAAGQVNPAMAALSALLAYARPGVTFVLGDGAVPGTGRPDLADDSTDGSDTRLWSDFAAVVNAIETEFGSVQNLIECWYNNDGTAIPTFKASFWPFYFGANPDGSTFTLGTTFNGRRIDHCLYDASAATNAKGRGIFTRAGTKWRVLTPMPFLGLPDSAASETELPNFSNDGNGSMRLREPARAVMHALTGETLAQSAGLEVGPSAHLCRFGGSSTLIHPDRSTPDGQVLLAWPIAIALLRAAGMTIGEPEIIAGETTVASDGSYAEFSVTLPNGGTLTTLAAGRGTTYSGSAPHQQPVTGMEIGRSGGARKPVFKTTATSYPATHRGTVTITDTGSGTGSNRRGKFRITPSQPFVSGDVASYLRGQANGGLIMPRDLDLYPWFLMERVPALYDATATYPCEGIAVKPYQADIAIPVAATFAARGARFDGTQYFAATSGVSVAASNVGLFSVWVKNSQATWSSPLQRVIQQRIGSTIAVELVTAASNRFTARLNNDTASDAITFYASPASLTASQTNGSTTLTNVTSPLVPGAPISGAGLNATVVSYNSSNNTAVVSAAATSTVTNNALQCGFALGAWYHILMGWSGTSWVIYVNGILVSTTAYATMDFSTAALTQTGIAASSTGSGGWIGDIGHLYVNYAQTLDLSVQANREKFALGGLPVNLGATGALPTGSQPAYYYDGAAPAWSNLGSAGNVTYTGAALTAATPTPSYTV